MRVDVSLDADLARFVEDEVSAGRHSSPADVVREALRLMGTPGREEAEWLRALQGAWRDGIDGGDAGELDIAALKEEARARSAAPEA